MTMRTRIGREALDEVARLRAADWYVADWDWIAHVIRLGGDLLLADEDLLAPGREPAVKPDALQWAVCIPPGVTLAPPREFVMADERAARAAREAVSADGQL